MKDWENKFFHSIESMSCIIAPFLSYGFFKRHFLLPDIETSLTPQAWPLTGHTGHHGEMTVPGTQYAGGRAWLGGSLSDRDSSANFTTRIFLAHCTGFIALTPAHALFLAV